ncbi:MAG: DivIVA domain-containing protein, partial [Candidatus Latescibacteria bacterium]|nr:DivIVA domain-containing protein [Candidatus Latescibacterota bacterium]
NLEKTLQDTLLTAQRATEATRTNSQREADLIVRDAQIRAEKIVDQARIQLSEIKQAIANLKMQKDSFLARLKALLNSQIELLETLTLEEEPAFKENENPPEESTES